MEHRQNSILGNTLISHSINKPIQDILRQRFENQAEIDAHISDLHDPYLLKDMEKAITRISQAKENNETLLIFGDYDVDGVTSTALLMHLFHSLKMRVSYRLPHRVHDGYGLKKYFIDEAKKLGVDLIVTVDCGSRDAEIVSYGKQLGIDIIVTDHHHVPEDMPDDAVAFINPNRPDCEYPCKLLSGVGVAFKIVDALTKKYFSPEKYQKYLKESIDIAALGTVADCMALRGENRIIVSEGLKQIKRSRSKGLYSLIEDKLHEELDADVFGFHIGPRVNAAGRMDTPYLAVNMLLNNGHTLPETLAQIETLNERRKSETLSFVDEALGSINPSDNLLIYHSPNISHGIIGIVAGRITEKYYKPSIVLIDEGDSLVASCRSPEYFSIIDILEKYSEYFLAFGGHKQAAGFSITKDKFPAFQEAIVRECNLLDFSKNSREIQIDSTLRPDEIGFNLLESISQFKPFGMGNPQPVFKISGIDFSTVQFLGKSREHLKFPNRYGFKIFAFRLGEYFEEIRKHKQGDLICELSEDNWQGQRGIMIRVLDIVV